MKNEILIMRIAGMAQIAMALGSLAIPKLLGWKQGMKNAPVLLQQMFWTYGGYIFCTNIWLGLVSLLLPAALLSDSPLSVAFLLYAALYWGTRFIIQIFYFNTSEILKTFIYKWGEVLLYVVFIFLTVVYWWSFIHQI